MRTRDQEYALRIREQVQKIRKQESYKKYGAMSHKLPVLIHSAGLAQALAFVESRKEPIFKDFLRDLSQTVGLEGTLCQRSRQAELMEYIHLTRKVLAALLWYKRFAQSILDVEADEPLEREGQ